MIEEIEDIGLGEGLSHPVEAEAERGAGDRVGVWERGEPNGAFWAGA